MCYFSGMRTLLLYLLFSIAFPLSCLCQSSDIPVRNKIVVGGSLFSAHEQGVSFGTSNPVFLVPMDTLGNVAFTGLIHGVRVIGRFAPNSSFVDTTFAEDPSNGEFYMICDTVYQAQKQGEWDYFYGKGFCYHEFYDKGILTSKDSWKRFFGNNRKGVTVADSMGRIRSIVDLAIKKGDGSLHH